MFLLLPPNPIFWSLSKEEWFILISSAKKKKKKKKKTVGEGIIWSFTVKWGGKIINKDAKQKGEPR